MLNTRAASAQRALTAPSIDHRTLHRRPRHRGHDTACATATADCPAVRHRHRSDVRSRVVVSVSRAAPARPGRSSPRWTHPQCGHRQTPLTPCTASCPPPTAGPAGTSARHSLPERRPARTLSARRVRIAVDPLLQSPSGPRQLLAAPRVPQTSTSIRSSSPYSHEQPSRGSCSLGRRSRNREQPRRVAVNCQLTQVAERVEHPARASEWSGGGIDSIDERTGSD